MLFFGSGGGGGGVDFFIFVCLFNFVGEFCFCYGFWIEFVKNVVDFFFRYLLVV